jgi:hypothetical protein
MEIIEKEVTHDSENKYAKKGIAGTALGLAIGALGLELLKGNGLNLFGNSSESGGCALTCKDKIELTQAIYQDRIVGMQERFADRQTLNNEMFGLYKNQIDSDFGLYKSYRDGFDAVSAKHNADTFALYKNQRDSFDVLSARISNLETKQAVSDAIDP